MYNSLFHIGSRQEKDLLLFLCVLSVLTISILFIYMQEKDNRSVEDQYNTNIFLMECLYLSLCLYVISCKILMIIFLAILFPDHILFLCIQAQMQNIFAKGESPEFSGKAVAALAAGLYE